MLTNHIVELIAPFLMLLPLPTGGFVATLFTARAKSAATPPPVRPRGCGWSLRPGRLLAGILFIGFQMILILSGNLSYLNYLTIIPALACFDDAFLCSLVPPLAGVWRAQNEMISKSAPRSQSVRRYVRLSLTVGFALLVAYLSVPIVKNLAGDRQMMNANFDRLKLVNTYGNFGSVGKVRHIIRILKFTLSLAHGVTCTHTHTHTCSCSISPSHSLTVSLPRQAHQHTHSSHTRTHTANRDPGASRSDPRGNDRRRRWPEDPLGGI